jgi:lipopolysaccharide transport system ATP-binding protein
MGDGARKGRTVLFVSHNLAAVEGLCNSAYLLDQGRLVTSGETHQVVEAYLSALSISSSQPLGQREDRQGNGRLRLTDITFRSANGAVSQVVQCGQDMEFVLAYEGDRGPLRNVSLSIGVYTMGGQCMLILNNEMVGVDFEILPSSGLVSCLVERFPLSPGQYSLNLYCEVNGMVADWIQEATTLTVEAGDFFGTGRLPPRTHGGILVPHRWRVTDAVGPRSAQGG